MRISRRDALRGGTAALAVAGLSMPAQARAVDPVLKLERQWHNFRDYIDTCPDDDETRDPLFARLTEIEDRLYVTPAQTLEGVRAKLRLWSYYYSPFLNPWRPWWRDDPKEIPPDKMGFAMAIRDLERMAGEARP